MNNIELKPAVKEDWQKVLEFEKGADSKTFHAMTTEQEIKEFFGNNNLFFILADNENVGVIAYEIKPDHYYISELIIGAEYGGKGFAKMALNKLLNEIGDKPAELHTHPENTAAIIVYLKNGFKIKEWIDNCYGDGEPRIVLRKD